jgi:hypothetical protein
VKTSARLYPRVILSREDGRRISKYDDRRVVAAVVVAEILRRLRAFRMTEDFSQPLSRVDDEGPSKHATEKILRPLRA